MASTKFQKGSEEFMLFQDFWKLCQKYWIVENTDNYWNDLVKESNEFVEKYKCMALSKCLALAFMDAKEKEGIELNK